MCIPTAAIRISWSALSVQLWLLEMHDGVARRCAHVAATGTCRVPLKHHRLNCRQQRKTWDAIYQTKPAACG